MSDLDGGTVERLFAALADSGQPWRVERDGDCVWLVLAGGSLARLQLWAARDLALQLLASSAENGERGTS